MFRLMDRVSDGIAPMLKCLEDHIIHAGLADMMLAAELITQVTWNLFFEMFEHGKGLFSIPVQSPIELWCWDVLLPLEFFGHVGKCHHLNSQESFKNLLKSFKNPTRILEILKNPSAILRKCSELLKIPKNPWEICWNPSKFSWKSWRIPKNPSSFIIIILLLFTITIITTTIWLDYC